MFITQHQEEDDDNDESIREIHALTPPHPRQRSPSRSFSGTETENFTTMSREFNALVLAGNSIDVDDHGEPTNRNLQRIGEEEVPVENNALAIVADDIPVASPVRRGTGAGGEMSLIAGEGDRSDVTPVQRVKKEEVESKISAWQNAKIAKINNRFKRDGAIINGWESEQVQKSASWMKKVERKLEEKRARAMEKMQNEVAKARRKAEERRATIEAKRGTKVARVIEIANLMRAIGRAPTKRSFF